MPAHCTPSPRPPASHTLKSTSRTPQVILATPSGLWMRRNSSAMSSERGRSHGRPARLHAEAGDKLADLESPREAIPPRDGSTGARSNGADGVDGGKAMGSSPGAVRRGHIQLRIGSYRSPELRPELIAIAVVYLVQGLLGLSRLAVFTFFKDDLALDPASVGLLTGLGYAPWVIKPVYGFLSDAVPLWGYRRRSYLVVCGALGAVSWATLASAAATPAAAVTALLLGSMSTACADVVADSIVVELSRGEPQSTAGSLQSLCWASASAGGIMSAYFSGSLVQDFGPRPVFWVTAFFPLMILAAAAAIPEEKVGRGASAGKSGGVSAFLNISHVDRDTGTAAVKAQFAALWGAMMQRSIFLPAFFVFLWQATPTADTAMLFFETNKLGFTTEFLGRIRLVAAVASLAGVGIYNFCLKNTPLRTMFLWTGLAGTGLGMTQLVLISGLNRRLGLSDELFALGDSALLTVLGQVSFMPVLVLAARLCPPGVEATLFATLMSILKGGTFVGSAFGSLLTRHFGVTSSEFDNLGPLVALCTLLTLAPLPLLCLLPKAVDKEGEKGDE